MRLLFALIILSFTYIGNSHSQKAGVESMMRFAETLVGKKYIKNPLGQTPVENLIVREDGFDCTTFVEWVLAKHLSEHRNNVTESSFQSVLIQLRYRNACIDGYTSRLHYCTEWIEENIRNGFICDVTEEIGFSDRTSKKIRYMTANRVLYPALTDSVQYHLMKEVEERISAFRYHYIPSSKVSVTLNNLKHGDMVAFISSRADLDIAHVGFAYEQRGKVYLLHASEQNKRVEISNNPLDIYLKERKKFAGIRVLRIAI